MDRALSSLFLSRREGRGRFVARHEFDKSESVLIKRAFSCPDPGQARRAGARIPFQRNALAAHALQLEASAEGVQGVIKGPLLDTFGRRYVHVARCQTERLPYSIPYQVPTFSSGMLKQNSQIGQGIVQILQFAAIGTLSAAQFDHPVLHYPPGALNLQEGSALISFRHGSEIELVPSRVIRPGRTRPLPAFSHKKDCVNQRLRIFRANIQALKYERSVTVNRSPGGGNTVNPVIRLI